MTRFLETQKFYEFIWVPAIFGPPGKVAKLVRFFWEFPAENLRPQKHESWVLLVHIAPHDSGVDHCCLAWKLCRQCDQTPEEHVAWLMLSHATNARRRRIYPHSDSIEPRLL